MSIIRFNIDKGKLIYCKDGLYLYEATHKKIIDRLHETFDLSGVKITNPVCFCVIYKKGQFIILNNIVLNSIDDEIILNHLVEYSEHKKIIDNLEKELFGNSFSY